MDAGGGGERADFRELCASGRLVDVSIAIQGSDAKALLAATDSGGFTPLHDTVIAGHYRIATWLLNAGADPNAAAWNGETPLHAAAATNSRALVNLLLSFGADPSRMSSFRKLPEDLTVDPVVLDLLFFARFVNLTKGCMPATIPTSSYGERITACITHSGAFSMLHSFALDNSVQEHVSEIRKEQRLRLDLVTEFGFTPLHYSVLHGHAESTNALLSLGASPNALSAFRASSALHLALIMRRTALVQTLMDKGADAKLLNHAGLSGIDIAHHMQFAEGERIVSEVRIKPTVKTGKGRWGDKAANSSKPMVSKSLAGDIDGATKPSGSPIVKKGPPGKRKLLLLNGLTSGTDANGSELASAAEKPKRQMAPKQPKILTTSRVRVVRLGISLHDAVKQENMAAISEALFEAEDINIRDNLGRTALLVAVQSGRIEMVKTMVNAGCDINAPSDMGDTPLHVAARNCTPGIIRILVSQGANLEAVNSDGKTPIEVCKKASLHHMFGKDTYYEEPPLSYRPAPQDGSLEPSPSGRAKPKGKPGPKKTKHAGAALRLQREKRPNAGMSGEGNGGPASPGALEAQLTGEPEADDFGVEEVDEILPNWDDLGYDAVEEGAVDEIEFTSYSDPYAHTAHDGNGAQATRTDSSATGSDHIMVEMGADEEGVPIIITASATDFPKGLS